MPKKPNEKMQAWIDARKRRQYSLELHTSRGSRVDADLNPANSKQALFH